MPSLRSIFSLLALGSVMVDNPMPRRLVANALRMIALVIASAVMAVALFLTIIAYFYKLMIANGVIELYAVSYIVLTIAVMTALLVLYTIHRAKKLVEEVNTATKKSVPLTSVMTDLVTSQAGSVAQAFLRGFLDKYHQKIDEKKNHGPE